MNRNKQLDQQIEKYLPASIRDSEELRSFLQAVNDTYNASERDSELSKEAFLANISHEIRTPMNAILGMSRQLEKTELDRQQHFYLKTINTATRHLMSIINDILDISKFETGKLNLEHIGFSPTELLKQIILVMQPRADEKGLELSLTVEPGIAPVLKGDPHRLNQVLLNLASNAVKFTDKGSVKLLCKVQQSGERHQTLLISVKDTGIGMDEHFMSSLFGKFNQEDHTTERRYGGTGLGMAITKQLTELMSGSIAVNSEKGTGTEILLSIPFLLGSSADLPDTTELAPDGDLLKGKRILLVEDNEMNRLVVTTMLSDYQPAISEVSNGEEAVNYLSKIPYDLVLMDLQMPVMNGFEATEVIRSKLKLDVPIIALTANAIKGERERCIRLGMNDFIAKPFEENELVNTIANCLQKKMIEMLPQNEVAEPGELPLYNLSKLEKISHGNDAFVQKMISLFLTQVPQAVVDIRTAFMDGDYKTIGAAAHKMKPALDSMEIYSLKETVRSLEHLSTNEPGSVSIEPLIAELEKAIAEVKIQLEKKG